MAMASRFKRPSMKMFFSNAWFCLRSEMWRWTDACEIRCPQRALKYCMYFVLPLPETAPSVPRQEERLARRGEDGCKDF